MHGKPSTTANGLRRDHVGVNHASLSQVHGRVESQGAVSRRGSIQEETTASSCDGTEEPGEELTTVVNHGMGVLELLRIV